MAGILGAFPPEPD